MNLKDCKILILKTKLENESKGLGHNDLFKILENRIGWQQYNDIYNEFANNSLFDAATHEKLTELGKRTLSRLENERKQEVLDENASRKKLHNESVISGWKKKTFWYIFAFGLFGGVYSGIDLFNKITDSKEVPKEQKTTQEKEVVISKSHTSTLDQKNLDSLGSSNNYIDSSLSKN